MRYLLPFLVALGLAYLLTWFVRLGAGKAGLVDAPRPDRWHHRPVPRLGGVAIYLAFTGPLLALGWPEAGSRELLALLVGGVAIFGVGLLDDLVHLENRPKLILLILCASIPALFGVRFELLSPVVGTPLAIIWILGATNAFNWLDNMDGVAAGVAAIASANLVLFTLATHGSGPTVPAVMLAGAALGFLLHNFPPARVFMGDSGSGFLGFTLATITVMGSYKDVSNVLLTVLVPGLILSVPILDTAVVVVQRVLNRRSIFQGGRDHPAHRLVTLGLPERRAVMLMYGLAALSGGIAVGTSVLSFIAGMSVSIILLLTLVAFALVLSELRVYEGTPPPRKVTPLPRPFWNKKWIFIMFLDIVLVSLAYASAHLLRHEGRLPPAVAWDVERTLPVVLGAKMTAFYLLGIYRGTWRYAGMLDMFRLAEGVTAGSLLAITGLFLWTRLEGFSRSALILDWMLTLLLVGGSRLSLRLVREYLTAQVARGDRVLIFGAGRGGTLLLREIRQNSSLEYRPIGFIDDDVAKQGALIHGLPVLGGRGDLLRLIRRHRVSEVLIAAPSCPPEVLEEVVVACRASGVRSRKLELILQ